MKIEIEYKGPVLSVNHQYYTDQNGRRRIAKAYKEYKSYLGWLVAEIVNTKKADMIINYPIFKGKVKMDLFVNFGRRGRDTSDILKPLEDAFTGIIYTDDKMIFKHNLEKSEIKGPDGKGNEYFIVIFEDYE